MAEDMYPKPTVARVVHYNGAQGCYAAMITKVNENDTVNLHVFPPDTHESFLTTNVDSGRWHWPERV